MTKTASGSPRNSSQGVSCRCHIPNKEAKFRHPSRKRYWAGEGERDRETEREQQRERENAAKRERERENAAKRERERECSKEREGENAAKRERERMQQRERGRERESRTSNIPRGWARVDRPTSSKQVKRWERAANRPRHLSQRLELNWEENFAGDGMSLGSPTMQKVVKRWACTHIHPK